MDLKIETELLNYLRSLIVNKSTQPILELTAVEIPQYERKVEALRDVIISGAKILTPDELTLIRFFIENSDNLIANNQVKLLFILGLASILEPVSELSQYAEDIEAIVIYLLNSSERLFKYAALDIIAAGLGLTPLSERLLIIAKVILADEPVGYVKDYLDTLS